MNHPVLFGSFMNIYEYHKMLCPITKILAMYFITLHAELEKCSRNSYTKFPAWGSDTFS
jgi:hypothetical protein